MNLRGRKILVTGGRGYIGSHTAKTLIAADAEVFIIDKRYVSKNKVKGTTLYGMGDYDDPEILNNLREKGVDGVVHCAGTSLVGPSVDNPSEYYNNNVIRTIRMLDHLKEWDTPPFVVFSSSAAVYGEPSEVPILETAELRAKSPYGNSKLMIERVLQDYETAYGIRSWCFRYFNAVGAAMPTSNLGPEEGDTHIIPRIFDAYYNNKPFKLYGTGYNTPDGTCIRDYVHVEDIATAHMTACHYLASGNQSKIYNLGTGTGYSNSEILTAFTNIIGPVDIRIEGQRTGDPDQLIASSSKFTADTKWLPQFSDVTTILTSYRDYYEKRNN